MIELPKQGLSRPERWSCFCHARQCTPQKTKWGRVLGTSERPEERRRSLVVVTPGDLRHKFGWQTKVVLSKPRQGSILLARIDIAKFLPFRVFNPVLKSLLLKY